MSKKTARMKKNPLPTQKPWPNLPQQLLSLLERKPTLMQNITSFGGVAKSWRPHSTKCSPNGKSQWPQLVEINEKDRNIRPHTIEISFHEAYPYPYYKRRSYEKYCYPGKYFQGHSHGQIVVMGDNFSDCFLWELSRRSTRYLPKWDRNVYFKSCTLSQFPDNPRSYNVMVLTGSSSPAFAFYKWGKCCDREWILESCSFKEPYSNSPGDQKMSFTNAIGFRGKFYALSLQGSVVVIEDVDSCFRITGIGGNRAAPWKVSRQFREYLVESDGEILLVFLVSRKSIDFVDDVEVFRLDVSRLLWVKVESIGDRALFLEDECCMGVDARGVGCKKNCVYFSHDRSDKWWTFDMESSEISPGFGTDNAIQEFGKWDEPMEVE